MGIVIVSLAAIWSVTSVGIVVVFKDQIAGLINRLGNKTQSKEDWS